MSASVYAFDTSAVVAALLEWHERHDPSLEWLEFCLTKHAPVVLPVHGLAESYSVLTRLPSPHRISAAQAASILEDTFRADARLAGLGSRDAWKWLARLPELDVAGGRTYDAVIYASAVSAGATHLVTLDERGFAGLGDALQIVVPD